MRNVRLTEKQKRFVDFYVATGNASEAARKAGYSSKTANRMGQQNLSKLDIQQAIKARLDAMESKRIATATEVMQFLTSAMRGEVQEEVVVIEGTGRGFSDARKMTKQLSAHERLDAAKQLAKRFGLDAAGVDGASSRLEFTFERDSDED